MKNTKDTKQEKQLLIKELKEKVQMLKNYGINETEIMSLIHTEDELPLPKLTVGVDGRIFLGDERMEVHMEPLIKAVYLLFLKHPEGIMFKNLTDYRVELTKIYDKLRPWGLTERAMQSIEDVTNPTLNSINEKCARIRKIFSNILPSSVARYYAISGKRGEVKKIDLVRSNVIWECKMPVSQGL